ncbi:MAG: dipeptidase [Thermoanaerobaculia bacterium]|jgi:dipeptidase E|nr:dipeptidase [Thermoanaerobaculia bacterium]
MRLLLISSSTVHGFGFLDHPEPEIRSFLGDLKRVAFVPFAAHDHAAYTAKVRERLARMALDVITIDDLDRADAIFVGGGNTFRLLKTLYDRKLLDTIRERVRGGLPYIGSSAGTVIAAPTMRTTNDMPIVYPPSFDAFGFVSFQINPHYLDPDPTSTHKGETREDRIREFHEENETPVVGLREGSVLRVDDGVTLLGQKTARVFRRGHEPIETSPGKIEFD